MYTKRPNGSRKRMKAQANDEKTNDIQDNIFKDGIVNVEAGLEKLRRSYYSKILEKENLQLLNKSLEASLENERKSYSKLKHENEFQKGKAEDLLKTIQKLEDDIKAQKTNFQRQFDEKVKRFEKVEQNYKEEICKLNEKNSALSTEVKSLKRDFEGQQEKVSQVKQEEKRLEKELQKLQQDLQKKERELKTQISYISAIDKEKGELSKRLEAERRNTWKLKLKNSHLRDSLTSTMEKQIQEVKTMREEVSSFSIARQFFQQSSLMKEKNSMSADNQTPICSLKIEKNITTNFAFGCYRDTFRISKKEREKLEERLKLLKEDKDKIAEEVTVLQKNMMTRNKEFEELKLQFRAKEDEMKKKDDDIQFLHNTIESWKKENEVLESKLIQEKKNVEMLSERLQSTEDLEREFNLLTRTMQSITTAYQNSEKRLQERCKYQTRLYKYDELVLMTQLREIYNRPTEACSYNINNSTVYVNKNSVSNIKQLSQRCEIPPSLPATEV